VRRSSNGVLQTTIEVLISTNTILNTDTQELDIVQTPTYEGALTGPTLRVKPGDSLRIEMINNLPPNPAQQRTGAFPHDPFTTNFHSHGLTVDPNGISDNVLRRFQPGTTNSIQIDIPANHLSGTMWYHPHKHGSVSFQFFGGMSGFLIIEGGEGTLDEVPEVKAAEEQLMAFQVIRTDQDGVTPYVDMAAIQFSSDPQGNIGLWNAFIINK